MADQLQLDIIVNEQGSAQKLAAVDAGVNKVVASAKQGAVATAQLSTGLGGVATMAGRLVGVTSGVAGFFAVVRLFRQAADDADRFSDAADRLKAPAERLQAIGRAGESAGIGTNQFFDALGRLQTRFGQGGITADLRALNVDIVAFSRSDAVERYLLLSDAIGKIEDPADRAAAAVRILGRDGEQMAGTLTTSFRQSVDEARTFSKETIAELDKMKSAMTKHVSDLKILSVEAGLYFLKLMGRGARSGVADAESAAFANIPGRPGSGPEPLGPAHGPSNDNLRQMLQMDQEDLDAANEMREAIRGSLEASIELQRIWGSELPEAIVFMSPVLEQIRDGQALIVADAEKWNDVLESRVNATLATTVGLIDQAIVKNAMLMGGAQSERDRLMQKLTATTDPNQSEFDKRFNEIDQETKRKLAAVDQTDRATAQQAENAILEETNLKVLELQQSWEGVNQRKDEALRKAGDLKGAYDMLGGALGPGGQQLPNGLVAPTADQVASGRYFGPVTPHGDPDLARMGGAASVTNHYSVDARGSIFDSVESFTKKVEANLAKLEGERGGRVARRS